MLTTYASYVVAIWIGFASVYLVHFLGQPNASATSAAVYLAFLPFLFAAPSIELLIHVDESDRIAIRNYVAQTNFATLRLAAIGSATGAISLCLLYFAWDFGWSYSQSKEMVTVLLLGTLALSIAGPVLGLWFLISRGKGLSTLDADANLDDNCG